MRKTILAASVALVALGTTASAEPGGCLKYGAAGAVAGHMVHHGVRGFLAGCAVGMYRRHQYRKELRATGPGTVPVAR